VVVFNAIGGPPGDYTMKTDDGTLLQKGLRQWQWSRPGPRDLQAHGRRPRREGRDQGARVRDGAGERREERDVERLPHRRVPAKPLKGDPRYVPPADSSR
jgi:hypothetical protein